jgi:HK97 family phage major capsid protein
MSAYTKSLREDYARAVTEYQEKLSAAENAEELDAAEAILNGAELIEQKFTKLESAEALQAKLAVARAETAAEKGISVDQHLTSIQKHTDELKRYLLGGFSALSGDEYNAMLRRTPEQFRAAASVGTNTAGGYTVAPEYFRELQVAMIAQGGVRTVARVVSTSTGADLPVPNLDDTAQVAALINENTSVTAATDLPFGSTTLHAYKWTSNELAVSNELMNDSAFDVDSIITQAIASRFVRGQNSYFTTGTGTSQPQGVVVASSVGATGAAGQVTSVIYSDLITTLHALNPVYRQNARWMFHDTTLKALKLMVDGQSRPLWQPGFAGFATDQPDTILGHPYTINMDMPVMAASAKSILFGDFSSYMIRDVQGGLMIRRLNERRALEDQVSYVAFMRSDGRKVAASTANTIVRYTHPAS